MCQNVRAEGNRQIAGQCARCWDAPCSGTPPTAAGALRRQRTVAPRGAGHEESTPSPRSWCAAIALYHGTPGILHCEEPMCTEQGTGKCAARACTSLRDPLAWNTSNRQVSHDYCDVQLHEHETPPSCIAQYEGPLFSATHCAFWTGSGADVARICGAWTAEPHKDLSCS